jgi:multidrug efflux pump subunit AcrA (membrane-fusion protein)
MVIAPDSTAHKKTVTLGIQNAEAVQILGGLTPSDMVISTGAYGLDENTKVKIGADTDADSGKDADDK